MSEIRLLPCSHNIAHDHASHTKLAPRAVPSPATSDLSARVGDCQPLSSAHVRSHFLCIQNPIRNEVSVLLTPWFQPPYTLESIEDVPRGWATAPLMTAPDEPSVFVRGLPSQQAKPRRCPCPIAALIPSLRPIDSLAPFSSLSH